MTQRYIEVCTKVSILTDKKSNLVQKGLIKGAKKAATRSN